MCDIFKILKMNKMLSRKDLINYYSFTIKEHNKEGYQTNAIIILTLFFFNCPDALEKQYNYLVTVFVF